MKWCVSFPEETIMVARPSLIAICMGSKPAAYLLSVLLYRYSIRKEHQEDAENINEVKGDQGKAPDQDTSCHIYRKQSQLVEDMCGTITEKTIHDVAVPTLQLLGFLDIEEHIQCNRYTLHIDVINVALEVYKNQNDQLEKFLINNLQLEKFLMTSDDRNQLELLLIDKKKFQLPLEKVLIANRKSSNCARGRKASADAVLCGKSEKHRLIKDNNTDSNKDTITQSANASASETKDSLSEIEKAIALLRANGITVSLQAPDPIETIAPVESQDTATAKLDNVPPSETLPQQELFDAPTTNDPSSPVEVPIQQGIDGSKHQGTRRRSKKNAVDQGQAEKPTLKPVLTDREIAFNARCAGIYQRIIVRRGFEFNTKEELIAERKAIRSLAENFTDEQIDFIHKHLDEKHHLWSKPESRGYIGAWVIWKESNKVVAFYKQKQTKINNGRPQQESDLRELYRQQLEWEAEAEREMAQ